MATRTPKPAKLGRPPVDEPLNKKFFRVTDREWEEFAALVPDSNRSAVLRDIMRHWVRRAKGRRHSGVIATATFTPNTAGKPKTPAGASRTPKRGTTAGSITKMTRGRCGQ